MHSFGSRFLLKVNTCTIDTVSYATLIFRSIIKDMTKVAITLAASYLGPDRAQSIIFFLNNFRLFNLTTKGRPSTPTVIFHFRCKERDVTDNTEVYAFCVVVIVFVYFL